MSRFFTDRLLLLIFKFIFYVFNNWLSRFVFRKREFCLEIKDVIIFFWLILVKNEIGRCSIIFMGIIFFDFRKGGGYVE